MPFRNERANTNKLNRKVGHDTSRHDKMEKDGTILAWGR